MSTPPVQPTQAPSLISVTRQADGSMLFVWDNNVPTGAQTYDRITIHQRVGGQLVQINNIGYPPISNKQYVQYTKYGGGAFNVGEAYTFALRAHGPAGSSGFSQERTVAAMKTPTPTFTSVERTGPSTVKIILVQNHNAPAVTTRTYVMGRHVGSSRWIQFNATTTGSQSEIFVSNLDQLREYEWYLYSSGPAGSSDPSTTRTSGIYWTLPAAVSNLQGERDAISGASTLTWGGAPTERGPYSSIRIYRRTGTVGQFTLLTTLPGTRRSYVDTTALPQRDYEYEVISVSPLGESSSRPSRSLAATVNIPQAPSNVSAVYETTGAANRVTVTWTRNVPSGRPVTGQQVGWQLETADPSNPAAYTWITVGSTATSYTFSAGANRRVRTTVRASNAAGTSEIATPSGLVTTTPAGPASLTAAWQGDDIVVSWPAYSSVGDRLVLEFTTDGSTWFPAANLAVTARSWRHDAPTKTVPHTYRARVESDATDTPDSAVVTSNVLAGLTKPAPPTIPQPEVLDATEALLVQILHNPLDGSAQTAGQVRVGTAGAVFEAGTDPFVVIPAGTFTNGTSVALYARTAGQSGEWSDWSPVPTTVTLRARPVPVLTGPALVVEGQTATAAWTASGQVSATVELLDSNGLVLEAAEVGAAARSHTFAYVLEDNTDYSVRLVVRDSWQASLPVVRVFTADIISPSEPSLSARFDPVTATVVADITGGEGERLELWRLDRDGAWRPKGEANAAPGGRANTHPNPSFEQPSPIPAGSARTDAWAADGAWSIHVPAEVTHVGGGVWQTSAPVTHSGGGRYETHDLITVTHLGSGRYEMEEA